MVKPGVVFIGVAVALLAIAGCSQQSDLPTQSLSSVNGITGNGAPNGAHYNLNIIGVPKNKTADMTGSGGHRIFVPLYGNAKILLAEGPEFLVLDANGTDGNGAKFQLPDPFAGDGLVAQFAVYARALGKPGGQSRTTTCFTDSLGETYCSADTLTLVRSFGRQKFTDVSRALLTVYADINGDGVAERVGLFDDASWEFFWSYDNSGLKLAQLRFYPIETDLN